MFGDTNPSGRLPVTFPAIENEMNFTNTQYPGRATNNGLQTNYMEKLLVGYRWYHAQQTSVPASNHFVQEGRNTIFPAFCFGHGLSCTNFKYSSPRVSRFQIQQSPLGDIMANVTCVVKNVGAVVGAEVVQVYLTYPASAREPP